METPVWGAVAGASIVGLLALIGIWLTQRHEVRRGETAWFRDKLLESYSQGLYYLVKLGLSAINLSAKDPDVRQHYSEAQRYLLLLKASSSDLAATRLRECSEKLVKNWDKDNGELAKASDDAVNEVKSLLEHDQRLKIRIKVQ